MANSQLGRTLRQRDFSFDSQYVPLNHGSYGAFPKIVRDRQRELQDLTEGRSDHFIRYSIPQLLRESRDAVAPLLGVSTEEVVFVPNATTAVNTVLRNLDYRAGDIIVYFSTAYGACEKTIQHVCETTAAESYRITLSYPFEDVDLIDLFRKTITQLSSGGKRVRLAMFDTVVSFPGVRLPWEGLVGACKDLSVLSLIDGAHGIGHIDLTHLGRVGPDFFTSNAHKWLYVPRGSAVFHVPRRNWHLIKTSLPTSRGFTPKEQRGKELADPFGNLFYSVATTDTTPYLCAPSALEYRSTVLGGEENIRRHCFDLAKQGGTRMAEILGTDVLDNRSGSLSQCCFTMVRLPLNFSQGRVSNVEESKEGASKRLMSEDGPDLVKWIMETLMREHDTWIPGKFFQGAAWMRVSAQTYLEPADFIWAAEVLQKLCQRIMSEDVSRRDNRLTT